MIYFFDTEGRCLSTSSRDEVMTPTLLEEWRSLGCVFDTCILVPGNDEIRPHTRYLDADKQTIHAIPDAPSANHRFDYGLKQWVDPRTLVELKDAKWAEIKLQRAALIDAPLTTTQGVFDSYAEARRDISDAVLLAQTANKRGQPSSINFTLADNTVVSLTLAQMEEVGLTLGAKVQTVRGIATALRTQIYAATTIAEVEDIVWP